MKNIFLPALFLLVFSSSEAQKVIHDDNARVRNVSGFHSISVQGGIDLFLAPGEEMVAVSAKDDETASQIRTEVENGVLKIFFDAKDKKFNINKKLTAYVAYQSLRKISASGGSDVACEGKIVAPSLLIDISGGSDFKGAVEVGKLEISQSSGSDVVLSGHATEVVIRASAGSDLVAPGLDMDKCTIELSGGSDAIISVKNELDARASGGSDIIYKGSPATVRISKSGGSDILRRN